MKKTNKNRNLSLICSLIAAVFIMSAMLTGCGCSSKGGSGIEEETGKAVSSDEISAVDSDSTDNGSTDDHAVPENSGSASESDAGDSTGTEGVEQTDSTDPSDAQQNNGNTSGNGNSTGNGSKDNGSYLSPDSPNADPVETVEVPRELDGAETVDEHVIEIPDETADSAGASDDTSDTDNSFDTISDEDMRKILSSRIYNMLYKRYYRNKNGSYNWYEFYNGCILGTVDLTSDGAIEYAKSRYSFFIANDLPEEAEQARTVLEAARAVSGVDIDID